MCGIAGIIGNKAQHHVLSDMLGAMHHRGPDDRGDFVDNGAVAIGMNRLAILDLSPLGHQPMQSHCGRYWIVYNGECYNFRQIRNELEGAGDKFRTQTDTEIVLQAFVRYGKKALDMFNGMYAFAIWDTLERKLFAARDRLGIKPFYYTIQQGDLLFGSEIKTLLASGRISFEIDPQAAFQYFTFGYIQQPATIIQSVRALMPGHYLEWKEGDLKIEKYWDITQPHDAESLPYEEAKEKLYSLITDSVKMQLVSDRPLGLFLSGGLDSATVLAAMQSQGADIKSFSIGFHENPYARDESEETSELARYLGATHTQLILDAGDVRPELENYWNALDQPSVDGLNTYLVSKYASQHMTVALSGLGGDELFAGYSRHARILWKLGLKNPVRLLAGNLMPLSALTLKDGMGKLAFRLKAFSDTADLLRDYTYARTLEHPGSFRYYLTPDLRRSIQQPVGSYISQFGEVYNGELRSDLDKVLALDVKAFMSSLLLRDMDAASMWHSIEVRFPLIDHRLVEFSFSLPDSYKMGWNTNKKPGEEGFLSYRAAGTKKILADTMEKHLPPGLLDRPKNGFKLPLTFWLKGFRKETLRAMIFDRKQDWTPYVQENAVENELSKFNSGKGNGQTFWKILTFVGVITSLKRASKQ